MGALTIMRPLRKWLADDLNGVVQVVAEMMKSGLHKIRAGIDWLERKLNAGVASLDEDLSRWVD